MAHIPTNTAFTPEEWDYRGYHIFVGVHAGDIRKNAVYIARSNGTLVMVFEEPSLFGSSLKNVMAKVDAQAEYALGSKKWRSLFKRYPAIKAMVTDIQLKPRKEKPE